MKEKLIESFQKHIARIRDRSCVIVETETGYYHSYDRTLIKQRILAIKAEIFRLTYSNETHAILALRTGE